MTPQKPDDALEVLTEVRADSAAELDLTLLRECYDIQKRFQFDRDREMPLDAMRRLIERVVQAETITREAEANR